MTTFTKSLTTLRRSLAALALVSSFAATISEAHANVQRIPISTGQLSGLLASCLRQGGDDQGNWHVPLMCCATNEEGKRWCVACYAGNEQNPSECSVTTKVRASVRARQSDAPASGTIAPRTRGSARSTLSGSAGIVAPNN